MRNLIFISFRTVDGGYAASHLDDVCRATFGAGASFRDRRSLSYGRVFDKEIRDALDRACVVLAVIGPRWLEERGAAGTRVTDPEDWVHMEIREAIDKGIPIVPVLLDGREPLRAEELPNPLKSLALYPAAVYRSRESYPDLPHLMSRLREIPGVGLPARSEAGPLRAVGLPDRRADAPNLKRLNDLLGGLRWKEADLETARLLWLSSGGDPGRRKPFMIPPARVADIPWPELEAVNRLWLERSDGRFGFSPQLDAWRAAGGERNRFANAIGWRTHRWILYSEADFSSGAPIGHLPILGSAGGIRPFTTKRNVKESARTALLSYAMLAQAPKVRDQAARWHAKPVTEALDWYAYDRMFGYAVMETWAEAANGRSDAMFAHYRENSIRGAYTNPYMNMLSAAWVLHRGALLEHLADGDPEAPMVGLA